MNFLQGLFKSTYERQVFFKQVLLLVLENGDLLLEVADAVEELGGLKGGGLGLGVSSLLLKTMNIILEAL